MGVAKMPIKPDRLALKIAVGKFPLAKETITIEEETVEGSVPRKNKAIQRSEPVPASKSGKHSRAKSGKATKVANWIAM